MHAQSRRRVDFDHASTLILDRLEHAVAHHVDAADIEPDHLCGGDCARRHFGMDIVRHVGGRTAGREIGIVAQDDALALGRNRIGTVALARQTRERDIVEANLGQRRRMAGTAPRIPVELLDQAAHRLLAVADDLRRIAPCRRDQFVTDHQQTKVVAP